MHKKLDLFHINMTFANTVRFLSRVCIRTRDIDIANLSVVTVFFHHAVTQLF